LDELERLERKERQEIRVDMELKRTEVLDLIEQCLIALNAERPDDDQISVGEDTLLLGGESQLDSLDFVAFVADLEERLQVSTGRDFVLVGELDSSESQAFREVSALADRIVEMSAEAASG
jgi:acyl carrier protein